MRLLLDSSGPELLVALADECGVILERTHPSGTSMSRDIGAAVSEVLGELRLSDLAGVVVGIGPGTFIGSRIAISFANGLAAAGDVKLAGVNSLAAIGAVYGSGRGVVLRDAGRDEVYWLGPAGDGELRLQNYRDLTASLVTGSIASVVLEQPGDGGEQQQRRYQEILSLVSRAGALITNCTGVPAEGLRRLAGRAPSLDYLEPVYLRGFL